MNKILQFPLVRMLIAVLFTGIGLAVEQALLSVARSIFSIPTTGVILLQMAYRKRQFGNVLSNE